MFDREHSRDQTPTVKNHVFRHKQLPFKRNDPQNHQPALTDSVESADQEPGDANGGSFYRGGADQ
jgi:hypothetical protein